MEYIEAPTNWTPLPDQVGLFLAGGITGCPDWQAEMIEALAATNYVILNPRRKRFPIDEPEAAYGQIKWEFDHLRKVDLILFWFCAESIQPIALYELGAWSMTDKPLFVGVAPHYERRIDVEIQTRLARPDVLLFYSLTELARAVILFEARLGKPKLGG